MSARTPIYHLPCDTADSRNVFSRLARTSTLIFFLVVVFSPDMIFAQGAQDAGKPIDVNIPFQSDTIQAPYDAFVCFNKSFADCIKEIQGGAIQTLDRPRDTRSDRKPQKLGDLNFRSPQDGIVKRPKSPSSAPLPPDALSNLQALSAVDARRAVAAAGGLDGSHTLSISGLECRMGSMNYNLTFDPSKTSRVVFVSPILLEQLGEEQVRVDQARINCDRLIESFEVANERIAAEDVLSLLQAAISKYTSEISYEISMHNSSNANAGFRVPDDQDRKMYGYYVVPATNKPNAVAKFLDDNNLRALQWSARIREISKKQLQIEFKRNFDDANEKVDARLRELVRSLMILDRSTPMVSTSQGMRSEYANGAWVKQGTVVLSRWTR